VFTGARALSSSRIGFESGKLDTETEPHHYDEPYDRDGRGQLYRLRPSDHLHPPNPSGEYVTYNMCNLSVPYVTPVPQVKATRITGTFQAA